MESIIWKKIDEETHNLNINGVDMGNWNRSQMRHFIQVNSFLVNGMMEI